MSEASEDETGSGVAKQNPSSDSPRVVIAPYLAPSVQVSIVPTHEAPTALHATRTRCGGDDADAAPDGGERLQELWLVDQLHVARGRGAAGERPARLDCMPWRGFASSPRSPSAPSTCKAARPFHSGRTSDGTCSMRWSSRWCSGQHCSCVFKTPGPAPPADTRVQTTNTASVVERFRRPARRAAAEPETSSAAPD